MSLDVQTKVLNHHFIIASKTITPKTENNLPLVTTGVIVTVLGLIALVSSLNISKEKILRLRELAHSIFSFSKSSVPENSILAHHDEFENISALANRAKELDKEKLTQQEFLILIHLERKFKESRVNSLYRSAIRLKSAIAARRYFDKVWQIEMQYRGRKQQEFYRFVDNMLESKIIGEEFNQQIKDKLSLMNESLIKEGKTAIEEYTNSLLRLSENEYGLELLWLFKKNNVTDYMILRKVDNLIIKYKNKDLTVTDAKVMLPDIMKNMSVFDNLTPIIQIPSSFASPNGFAFLIYFMSLQIKHQGSYFLAQQLRSTLGKLRFVYNKLLEIRSEYDPQQFRLPHEFIQKIPGLKTFEKYKSLGILTDEQTDFVPPGMPEFGLSDFFLG